MESNSKTKNKFIKKIFIVGIVTTLFGIINYGCGMYERAQAATSQRERITDILVGDDSQIPDDASIITGTVLNNKGSEITQTKEEYLLKYSSLSETDLVGWSTALQEVTSIIKYNLSDEDRLIFADDYVRWTYQRDVDSSKATEVKATLTTTNKIKCLDLIDKFFK